MDDDFRTLFEFLPIGAYRSTPGGRMIRSNAALVRLNGCDSEAEFHALVHDIATEWYVDAQRRADFEALLERDGRVVGFVSEVRRQKTRERIWIRENAHVLRGPDGRVHCYEGTVEEITAEMLAQQALQASREELARIVDLLPGVVYKVRWDAQGRNPRVTFVSSKAAQLWGIDVREVLRETDPAARLVHAEDREQLSIRAREALDAQAPLDVELRLVGDDARVHWVRNASVPAPAEDGCQVRVGMLFDITDRQRAVQALRDEGQRWKRALESIGDAVWDWNLESGVEVMSGDVDRLYGYAPHELLPTPQTMDALTHPDDVAGMLAAREDHFAGRTRVYTNEHRIRCRDGSWKWVRSRGVVIDRAADGRALRMIGTHTDIDAVRRADEVARERDRVAAADRAKSDFLSRVSHELRTPLNAVLGFAQLLGSPQAALSPTHAAWAGHILSSGRHLLALVDDVLDLSAVESGQLRLKLEDVDLHAVVGEVQTMFEQEAAASGVRLQFPLPAAAKSAVVVRGDRTRCRQIVANLVSNAVKYNRRGGQVRLTLRAAAGAARLRVHDDGPGIAPGQRERLFAPFERLHATHGRVKGTGLGLALSRQLAMALQGGLELVDSAGHGACFELTLPLAGLDPHAGPADVPGPAP